MNLRRQKRFHAEVATASLNDIMFFLLLFFLIVSTLANPNVIKILLPKAKSSDTLNKQQITLTVTEEKHYFINTTEVAIDQLEQTLQQELANTTEPTIVLRAAKNLTIQDLVDVMQIGAKLKVKMVLATQQGS